ncbi:MAG: peptidylprolyl isomerase [Rhodovibrionaceae bacterium]
MSLKITSLIAAGAFCLLAGLAAQPASAQSTSGQSDTLRPAAVVNDEVISILDLSMRLRIAIVASGLPDSQETRNRLSGTVLRNLIDERLQLQEANRLEIEVPEAEIDSALQEVARRNEMETAQFVEMLQRNGILPSSLREQLLAQLSWSRVVNLRLRPEVEIGPLDIDAAIERMRANAGQPERRVAEIFLAVDNPSEEAQVQANAERLMQEIQQGGNFSALAQQFSQSPTAAVGGDLGWTQEGELPEELEETVASMEPGTIRGPIRTLGGFYIVALIDKRTAAFGGTAVWEIVRIAFPVNTGDDSEAVLNDARAISEQIEGCDDAKAIAEELGVGEQADLGEIAADRLPENVEQALTGLPVQQASPPLEVSGGYSVFVVCNRTEDGVDRREIEESLARERLERLARRYMRDLRRQANVDIRL